MAAPSLLLFSFFIVRRSLLGQKRSFWGVVEAFEKTSYDFVETAASARNVTGVK